MAEAELRSGNARRAMIVSGEYITHLTKTAQLELDGFLDPRLACLTLGDAGAAVLVELADDGSGFQTLDLYTAGGHHDLCVAKATNQPHGGAIMLTDAIRASAITLQHSMSHAHRTLTAFKWSPRDVRHLIMHQTSSTTIDGAVEEMNRFYGESVCDSKNTINNLARRGNTASTTHWIALMDAIQSGRVRSGENVLFAVSGSGQTVGTALYKLDSLPERILAGPAVRDSVVKTDDNRESNVKPQKHFGVRLVAASVESVGHNPLPKRAPYRVVESAMRAAKSCLSVAGWHPRQVQLLVHAGVYRDEFLSEPAVAAILAGELEIHHEGPEPDMERTLAFDVNDSSRGTLSAMRIAAIQIGLGNISRALITASEIENNPDGMERRGIAELASALALESSDDCEEGLCNFSSYDDPRYSDRLVAVTAIVEGQTRLVVHKGNDFAAALFECVAAGIRHHLADYACDTNDFARVLVAAPLSDLGSQLAECLGINAERLLISSESNDLDPFTSGIALLWQEAHRQSAPRGDERWLIVSAGAGIEVGCAEYHFRGQETIT
jgi:3-oxoacyl-[acyl-carrier-protein] synthase III